jgi:ABC-type nitrate/sulfonate/bicarbonate transport system ATPase subunit
MNAMSIIMSNVRLFSEANGNRQFIRSSATVKFIGGDFKEAMALCQKVIIISNNKRATLAMKYCLAEILIRSSKKEEGETLLEETLTTAKNPA